MTKHDPAGSSPIPLVPLLITESEEEFKRIRQALYEELAPVGIIEQMYVNEFADIVWEIGRPKNGQRTANRRQSLQRAEEYRPSLGRG
jgi:hypothetical protein